MGPGGQVRLVKRLRRWAQADAQQGGSGLWIVAIDFQMLVEQPPGDAQLIETRLALQCLPPGPANTLITVARALRQDASGERTGCFDISRIVKQHQSLLWDVGTAPLG